ncbi:HUB2 [Scenedesmus sp. PABB004]|nr:HUB2 [Scenedesmus sp. PABB004]
MAKVLVEKAQAQQVQVLQFQNTKLSEQLAALKEQIAALDGSVTKHEEQRKAYADTLLCVNRAWEQLNADVALLLERAGAAGPGGAGGPPAGDAAAAAAAAADGAAPPPSAAAGWEGADPFLERLLAGQPAPAVGKAVKKAVAGYAGELSDVEAALHARAAATQAALGRLLDALRVAAADADARAAALRGAAPDAALSAANAALADEAARLRGQLDAAAALQRATAAQLAQAEDRAFAAEENLKSIKNDLADKEYALQAAQRKLQCAKQQQQQQAAAAPSGGATASGGGAGGGSGSGPPGSGACDGGGGSNGGAPPPPPLGLASAPSSGALPDAAGAAEGAPDAAAEVAELQAQLKDLQGLLEQRSADKDAEAAAHSKTQRCAAGGVRGRAPAAAQRAAARGPPTARRVRAPRPRAASARRRRELVEARARLLDEGHVAQSALYRLAQQQLADAAAAYDARGKALAALQHDKDELLRMFDAKAAKEEVEKVLRSKLVHLQQQVDELNAKQMDLLTQRQQLQAAHAQELMRYGHAKTAAELTAMVSALQKEVATHTGHARKAAEASGAADVARQEALEARTALAAAQGHVRALEERLAARAGEAPNGQEEELRERVADLSAFVEVLTTLTTDTRGVVEVRRSEAELKARVAELSAKLNGDGLRQQLEAATASEAALRQEVERSASAAAELQARADALTEQVAALQGEVARKQQEAEAFAAEISEAYNAYEEQRQQNTALLGELTARDASLAGLQAERLDLQHQIAQLSEQLSAARVEVTTLRGEVGQLAALKEATEADCARVSAELAAAREQLLAAGASIERLRADLKAREEGKAAVDVLLQQERAAGALRARAAEDDAAALGEERAKRQRLQDSNKLLSAKLERLSRNANTSEAVAELEEEINALRRLLKCNVCHTRQKDVILTKCWHMFCKHCINKNLEARHRKCPGCGHPFGAADVKQFFFT